MSHLSIVFESGVTQISIIKGEDKSFNANVFTEETKLPLSISGFGVVLKVKNESGTIESINCTITGSVTGQFTFKIPKAISEVLPSGVNSIDFILTNSSTSDVRIAKVKNGLSVQNKNVTV